MESQQRNLFYLSLAYLSAGLGIVGAFLPVLPTTPFLLLAAWAATRGSPELHRWLYEHPRFGPALTAWNEKRAVATSAKWLASLLMAISWTMMWLMTESVLLAGFMGTLFVCVAVFLISRPKP